MANKTNPNKGINPDVTLERIEKVLQSDANYKIIEPEQKGKGIKPEIVIEDNRFQRIKDLINKNNSKSNRNYRKLIELISKYIEPIYDKEDFDQGTICSNEYNNKQRNANHKFVEQLFDYICDILKSNPNISLSADTLKNLLKKWSIKKVDNLRCLDFKKLASILRQNKTLNNSQIRTNVTYQILIDTFQLSNKDVFPILITPEQFNENHELIDEFLKSCNAYDFVNITDIIRKEFDSDFNESSLASKNMQEHFAEDLIYYLIGNRRKNEERDYALMHTVLSDKNRTIDFHTRYDRLENEDIELYIIIQMFGNQTIIKDMIEHPNAKDIYGFDSIDAAICLCRICCDLEEYEEFLKKLNAEKGATEYLSPNQEADYHLKLADYVTLNDKPQSLRTRYILEICDSLKSKEIDYNRIIRIISLIINDHNLNYFEANKVLPKLQELLLENDFKELLNEIAKKQKEGKLTLIECKLDNENKCIINRISIEDFEEMIKEYIGHQYSIGPTQQHD